MITLLIFILCNLFFKIPIGELTQDTRAIMMFICVVSDLHIILRACGHNDILTKIGKKK